MTAYIEPEDEYMMIIAEAFVAQNRTAEIRRVLIDRFPFIKSNDICRMAEDPEGRINIFVPQGKAFVVEAFLVHIIKKEGKITTPIWILEAED